MEVLHTPSIEHPYVRLSIGIGLVDLRRTEPPERAREVSGVYASRTESRARCGYGIMHWREQTSNGYLVRGVRKISESALEHEGEDLVRHLPRWIRPFVGCSWRAERKRSDTAGYRATWEDRWTDSTRRRGGGPKTRADLKRNRCLNAFGLGSEGRKSFYKNGLIVCTTCVSRK